MNKMLSKMNLISVVQQLPKEDIETIQGYVKMIEEEADCAHKNTLTATDYKKQLQQENQELKKQLEGINKMIEKYGFVNIEQVMLSYCGLIAQQKEFINYLEDYINSLKKKEYGNYVNDNYSEEYGRYYTAKEILQKYKSIIGLNNEQNKKRQK